MNEIMTLVKIRDGENPARLDKSVVRNLLDRKLIEKRGKTKGTNYILCRSYFEYAGDIAAYARKSDWDENQMRMMVFSHLAKYQSAKMGDFVSLFEGHLNRRQVRDNILKMVKSKSLSITGTGSGTRYSISEDFKKGSEVLGEILIWDWQSLIDVMTPEMSKRRRRMGVERNAKMPIIRNKSNNCKNN